MRGKYRWGSGGNGNIGEFIKGTTNLDASAYFNVTPQLKLTVEAINITDEPIVQYADKGGRADDDEHQQRSDNPVRSDDALLGDRASRRRTDPRVGPAVSSRTKLPMK